MKFWAHSDPSGLPPDAPEARWQTLAEHLHNVAKLSRRLAECAAPAYKHFHDLAEWSGLLHDYGKYSACFQDMIRGGNKKCPHAIHGAFLAFEKLRAPHIASAVAGHHAGMPDVGAGVLRDRVKEARDAATSILQRAIGDSKDLSQLLTGSVPEIQRTDRFDLLTRMLLSCLVDADRLDTARRAAVQAPLDPENRLSLLMSHLDQLAARNPDGVVKDARREVLEDCIGAASHLGDFFSLSVPTGGGKTLSGMAFALKRASLFPDRYRRIIVVIPYLSIIEQNADVYARIFGSRSILEHHSGSFRPLKTQDQHHFTPIQDDSERNEEPFRRPETENWDAPLIVTTSVRFFESLFSNHPSDLRRVHNMARSIVILDEVQVLPRPLLAPLLGIMDELATDWGCCFVFSTATKPAFERPPNHAGNQGRWPPGKVREIVHSPCELHSKLRRVSIEWHIEEPVDWPEVATWMCAQTQALCVVNIREHATTLFDQLAAQTDDTNGLFHLSTRMCPAHRLQVIADIRRKLLSGAPCHVVSTQLIEAGVDLDFPVAFRALGPLDSIIQVAGRADREGRLTAALGKPGGKLVVFTPLDTRLPPNEYENATGITGTLARIRAIQPDDLDAMAQFFEAYYGNADLGSNFCALRQNANFKTLADNFELISSRTQDIFVPFEQGKLLIDELLTTGQLTADLRRRFQRYTVGLQPFEFRKAQGHAVFESHPGSNIWIASDGAYDIVKGLGLSLEAEELVF